MSLDHGPEVYIPADKLPRWKQAQMGDTSWSQIALVNKDPPDWSEYAETVSGSAGYAPKFKDRCERLLAALVEGDYRCW